MLGRHSDKGSASVFPDALNEAHTARLQAQGHSNHDKLDKFLKPERKKKETPAADPKTLEPHEYPEHMTAKRGAITPDVKHAEQHAHGTYHIEHQGAGHHAAMFTAKRKGSRTENVGGASSVEGAKQRIANHVARMEKSEPNVRLLKANGEGSRGGHVTGHTKTGHPIYGHADLAHIPVDHQKKLTSSVKAYNKTLDAMAHADDGQPAHAAAAKARDKLYKVIGGIDDTETRIHLLDHLEGKHEGGLRRIADQQTKGEAHRKEMGGARIAYAAKREREEKQAARSGDGNSHDDVAFRQHAREMELARFNKSQPNVRRIG